MPNYFRNVDDSVSDPELIAGRYQIGRNVFFEVQLTLAEYADNARAASSGGTAASAGSTLINNTGGAGGGGYYGGGYCPREDQFVWVSKNNKPEPVKASNLLDLKHGWELYNPLTRNMNKLTSVSEIHDVPLIKHISERGASAVTSYSHKAIRNTGDVHGTRLMDMAAGSEILACFLELQNRTMLLRLYQDLLTGIEEVGNGTVIEITLEDEFIYMVGETPECGTLAHNRKEDPGDGEFIL